MHHRSAHPWTLLSLAHEVGVSRSVLSERFRHYLGESPITYLTRWRLGLGARALTSTGHTVAQIALDVGYESEAAFNPRWTAENRQFVDRAKPAISGTAETREFYFVPSSVRKSVCTLVRQLRGPHLSTCA